MRAHILPTWLLTGAATVGLVAVVACGIAVPSGDLPKVEQRWVVTALADLHRHGGTDQPGACGLHRERAADYAATSSTDPVQGEPNGPTRPTASPSTVERQHRSSRTTRWS